MTEANEKELVDEYYKINNLKKEIEVKLQNLKESITKLAVEKNTDKLIGTDMLCSVKEYEKVIYPDDKSDLVQMIKSKGLYDQLSSINYFKLGPRIIKGEIDEEIIKLVGKERAFRVMLKALKTENRF